jgi:hypothetical protein
VSSGQRSAPMRAFREPPSELHAEKTVNASLKHGPRDGARDQHGLAPVRLVPASERVPKGEGILKNGPSGGPAALGPFAATARSNPADSKSPGATPPARIVLHARIDRAALARAEASGQPSVVRPARSREALVPVAAFVLDPGPGRGPAVSQASPLAESDAAER